MNKYVLNSTYGINGIERISLKDIVKTFSIPKEIAIQLDSDRIDLNIDFIYNDIKIIYSLNFFVNKLDKPEFHYLTFCLKKLYFNEKENIKIGDEIKKALPKIKKYLKKNKKNLEFEYKFNGYYGNYLFDNGEIHIFFEKKYQKKIIDAIMVSLPYEDIQFENTKILNEIKEIMELKEKINKLFYVKK